MNHDELLETVRGTIQDTIRTTVNGKIDRVKADVKWIRRILLGSFGVLLTILGWIFITINSNSIKIAQDSTQISDIISSITIQK